MVTRHLTDSEIQSYLDGKLNDEQYKFCNRHFQICQSCRHELQRYEKLYAGLKESPAIQFSPEFSHTVLNKIETHRRSRGISRIWKIGLLAAGTLLAIGVMFYMLNIVSLFVPFFLKLKLEYDSIITGIQKVTGGLTIDISLFVLAGVILLLIFVIDSIITRHRGKLSSLIRLLPTLC